ncbi:MAG TPA: nucleotidyltransferase domain-containing protein [Myxococcaceae bacterium]|nr:nucleotidyltransferase domain-containing protein [Myxococcaceae bacterium]
MEVGQQRLAKALDREAVRLAVLFGSRAKGVARAESDWDVGLIVSAPVDWFAWMAELGSIVGGRVDLVDLARAPPLLAHRAATEGKVLLDRSGHEFASFASLALRKYWDTAKFRRMQEESLRRFVAARQGR